MPCSFSLWALLNCAPTPPFPSPTCLCHLRQQPFAYYIENYPMNEHMVLGFLSYDLLFALGLDRIYTANYFYAVLLFLAASLAACTSTRQFPNVRVRACAVIQQTLCHFVPTTITCPVPAQVSCA